MSDKIKVLMICHLSSETIRRHITFDRFYFRVLLYRLTKRGEYKYGDYAIWNSNAIAELEKYNDIDLTIVFPHSGIKGSYQCFTINRTNYICFRSQEDHFFPFLIDRLFIPPKRAFKRNRRFVSSLINHLNPDIVHIIGAENPYYSITALDIPHSVPVIVSLQTLLASPGFFDNYPISKRDYIYRKNVEEMVIKRSDYLAFRAKAYQETIKASITPNTPILDMPLALGVNINTSCKSKQFDFVYFSANINKACDQAIEAFAMACKKYPTLSLNISGAYSSKYKSIIDRRIAELDITHNVYFSGSQSSHEDVLNQIKKSRFALLPLKADLISSTIREAMACGLPVVSTITAATPILNEDRESVLLSIPGDYVAMANNMIHLLEDEDFASTIRDNALITVEERYSNSAFIRQWHQSYFEVISNFHYNTPFSKNIVLG